jgi:uncharacterized protein YbbC (DUF1343 family)
MRAVLLSLLALLLSATVCRAQLGGARPAAVPFMLGIDVLESRGFDLLRGKRVGLITNHTAYTSRGERSRVAMQRALGPALTTLFGPEHGIDGNESAGVNVKDKRDSVTGLVTYSLHGAYRKPQPFMLQNIDVLVFDVQDIGARSYTYISTLAVSMEAAAENGKSFVILDRPNPLGGLRVEGPPVEAKWKSFVSQLPIPYVHGMTVGELGMMASAKGWLAAKPKVTVARMQGWQRGMIWQDTGLRWHATSPNIPHAVSPAYYVTTGILGGAAQADIGIGSNNPFGVAAAIGVNAQAMQAYCESLRWPGVGFRPYSKNGFGGVQLSIDARTAADLTALDIYLLCELNRQTSGRMLSKMSNSSLSLFNKVFGSDSLYRDLKRGTSPAAIVQKRQGYTASFRAARQPYLFYP